MADSRADVRDAVAEERGPLAAFFDTVANSTGTDDEQAASLTDGLAQLTTDQDGAEGDAKLFPDQRKSIIDERAVVRYYRNAKKRPDVYDMTPTLSHSISPNTKPGNPPLPSIEDGPDSSFDVFLKLDVSTGCGGRIWPAAEVLGAYISSHVDHYRSEWKGKTIVELGAGTGLAGLLVARIGVGCKGVWITDQIPMMQLMRDNLALNQSQDPLKDPCHVAELNWGEPLPAPADATSVPSRPDVLLLADCVYLEIAFQPLVDTLVLLSGRTKPSAAPPSSAVATTAPPPPEILFCYQKRRKADKRFFVLLKKAGFEFDHVNDDDPERAEAYRRQGTSLLRVFPKGSRAKQDKTLASRVP